MKLVILLALCACSGGTTAKPTPTTPAVPGMPGLLWQTAVEPWHVPHSAITMIASGNVATLGGSGGWVFQLDLTTGKPIRDLKLPMGTVTDLLDLGDGRILAVGLATRDIETTTAAFVLDAKTFDSKPVNLPTRTKPLSFAAPHAVLVADGGIAISGRGLPLSIYDPKTFAVKATLDTQIGWGRLSAHGEILLAERTGQVKRFNVVTNGQRDLPRGTVTHLVAADGVDIMRVARSSVWMAELHPDNGAVVPLKEQIDMLAVIDNGKKLLTTARQEIRIHDLPSGEIKKRIPILDKQLTLAGLHVIDNRAFALASGSLRIIDLDTGVITPAKSTPQASYLAVGNDGTVLSGNEPTVWTSNGGKQTASETLQDGFDIEAFRSDDPRHYLTSKSTDERSIINYHTVGDPKPRTFALGTTVSDGWMGRDGALVFSIEQDSVHKMMLARAAPSKSGSRAQNEASTTPDLLFDYNSDSEVLAVDPDGEILISLDGRVAVVGLDGKTRSTIRVPRCEAVLDFGVIEPGGTRAITYDTKDLALWDRKTGKLLANVAAVSPEDILFLPKRPDIVVVFDDRVALWLPGKGVRTLALPGVLEPAASADGKKLALSFFDGHVAVFDVDALLAGLSLGPDFTPGEVIPDTCGETDPVAVPKPEEDDPPPPEEDEGD